jgi:hypothetical protein
MLDKIKNCIIKLIIRTELPKDANGNPMDITKKDK